MSEELVPIEKITEILAKDLVFIEAHLGNDPDGFWARTLIKTVGSYVEAEVFLLKQELLRFCEREKIEINPEVDLFLNNRKFELGSNGKLKERIHQARVRDEVKFIFNQISMFKGQEQVAGFEIDGWNKLISTIEVRNRLTHPKSIDDLKVSEQEIKDSDDAFSWFVDNVVGFIRQDRAELERRLKGIKKQNPLVDLLSGNSESNI
jgi:hypothetical protein